MKGGKSLRVIDLRPLEFVGIVDMETAFQVVKKSIAPRPSRWPLPVCFTPPKGRWTSAPMVGALM